MAWHSGAISPDTLDLLYKKQMYDISNAPPEIIYEEIMESLPWYALQVRPRFEKIVASTLVSKGYEGFLPLYRRRSRWSDRIKEV